MKNHYHWRHLGLSVVLNEKSLPLEAFGWCQVVTLACSIATIPPVMQQEHYTAHEILLMVEHRHFGPMSCAAPPRALISRTSRTGDQEIRYGFPLDFSQCAGRTMQIRSWQHCLGIPNHLVPVLSKLQCHLNYLAPSTVRHKLKSLQCTGDIHIFALDGYNELQHCGHVASCLYV